MPGRNDWVPSTGIRGFGWGEREEILKRYVVTHRVAPTVECCRTHRAVYGEVPPLAAGFPLLAEGQPKVYDFA